MRIDTLIQWIEDVREILWEASWSIGSIPEKTGRARVLATWAVEDRHAWAKTRVEEIKAAASSVDAEDRAKAEAEAERLAQSFAREEANFRAKLAETPGA